MDINCKIVPQAFPSARFKICFLILLLSDKDLPWANPLWENDKPKILDYPSFVASIHKKLLSIQHGIQTVVEYAIVSYLIPEVDWNNEALVTSFSHSISDALSTKLRPKTCLMSLRLSFLSRF